MNTNLYNQKDIKFIKAAKLFAEEFATCLSPRHVGSVVVKHGRVIGQGVNGSPSGVLHIEDQYTKISDTEAVFGQGWFYSSSLNQWIKIIKNENGKQEKYLNMKGELISPTYKILSEISKEEMVTTNLDKQRLVSFKEGSQFEIKQIIEKLTCPRYIIGCKSGENLNLCSCVHSEVNSIISAGVESRGATLYCYCPVPCSMCVGVIIQAGISKIVCLKNSGPDYSYQSRSWLNETGIEVIEIDESEIL